MKTIIRCKKCGDILKGDGKGHCIYCKCGNCYIDSTKYYCRYGGDFEVLSYDNERKGNEKDIIVI